jgi:hypothetical protein
MKPPILYARYENITSVYGPNAANDGAFSFAAGTFGNGVVCPAAIAVGGTWHHNTILHNGGNYFGLFGWFKLNGWNIADGVPSSGLRLFWGGINGNQGLQWYYYSSGYGCTVGASWNTGYSECKCTDAAYDVSANTLTHIGFVIDGTNVLHYINGNNIATVAYNVAGKTLANASSELGSYNDGQYEADFLVDNLTLINFVPTAAEVKRIMNAERGCMNDYAAVI